MTLFTSAGEYTLVNFHGRVFDSGLFHLQVAEIDQALTPQQQCL